MMNSTRSRRRAGSLESYCTCCRIDASNRTYRTREKRQWRKDQQD